MVPWNRLNGRTPMQILHPMFIICSCQQDRTVEDVKATKQTVVGSKRRFLRSFPSGEYLLVVIDDYSRYPEIETVYSTSARSTMTKLDKIFSTHGIQNIVKTDNGPPFRSHELTNLRNIWDLLTVKLHHYGQKLMEKLNGLCGP